MAADGILGNGVKVAYSLASPVSWQSIGQIMDTDLPELTPDKVNSTVHSTSRFKRAFAGLIEVGDMKLNLLADPDPDTAPGQKMLRTLNISGQTVYWRVEVPVNRQQTEYVAYEFEGLVAGVKHGAPIDDAQTYDVTIRFDGDYFTEYAPGASAIS